MGCGMECATLCVECCVMWNKVGWEMWDVMCNIVRCGKRQCVGCGMECATLHNVECCARWNEVGAGCDMECGTLCDVE